MGIYKFYSIVLHGFFKLHFFTIITLNFLVMKIDVLNFDKKLVESYGWEVFNYIEKNQIYAYEIGKKIIGDLLNQILNNIEKILSDLCLNNRLYLIKNIETANFLIQKIY